MRSLKKFILRLVLPVVFFIIPLCPKALVNVFASILYFLAKPFLKKDLGILHRNARDTLMIPENQIPKFAKECLYHQIICGIETIKTLYNPLCCEILNHEKLEEQMNALSDKGRGIIAITAHCGSWELAGQAMATYSQEKSYVLAKPGRQRFITNFLQKVRQHQKTLQVLWNDDSQLLKKLITSIKERSTIGFVMDQRPGTAGGISVRFFNKPTEFVVGPAKLSIQYGCSLISIFCIRVAPFKYKYVSRIITPR